MLITKKPVQGIWGLVEKMLEKYGALNKKYDADLNGIIDNADKVDGHDAGTGAGDVLVLDTAGQVPLANIPLLPASQLGFSFAWELVGSISETGVSSIEFSNLAGDTDKLYYLVVLTSYSGTVSPGIYIRLNDDTTIGNYCWIVWYNNAGTVNTASQSFGATSGKAGINFAGAGANAVSIYHGLIYTEGILHGTETYVPSVSIGSQTNKQLNFCGGAWKKSSEVTSITLFTDNGSDANWLLYLFKPKW